MLLSKTPKKEERSEGEEGEGVRCFVYYGRVEGEGVC